MREYKRVHFEGLSLESYREKVLECRDKRFEILQEMVRKFGHCVVVGVNFPGQFKRTAEAKKVQLEAVRAINHHLGVKRVYQRDESFLDGEFSFFAFHTYREGRRAFKKRLVEIEESNYLGRFFDLDYYVLDLDDTIRCISRLDINMRMRPCYICTEVAKVCVKKQTHSSQELFEVISKRVKNFKRWMNLWR